MRFLADGPSIPDDLLVARDEGRVAFFCGAGVSRARVGLPGFFELARTVIDKLHVSENHGVRKLIEEAERIEDITGISGVISADRLFGLLEREFLSRDIHAAVADSLMLIEANEDFRSGILRQFRAWSEDGKGSLDERLVTFLANVWPRQISVRTPRVFSRLVDLSLSSLSAFPRVIGVVLQLVGPVEREDMLMATEERWNKIAQQYPNEVLALLFAMLSDQASHWPYRVEKVLQDIESSCPSLSNDARLTELKRRWDSR
jgi:hypothetical protein